MAGFTTSVAGSTSCAACCGSESRPNSWRRVLNTFSCAHRERSSPATSAAGRLGCVVRIAGWRRPADGRPARRRALRGCPLRPEGRSRSSIQKRISRAGRSPCSRSSGRAASCPRPVSTPSGVCRGMTEGPAPRPTVRQANTSCEGPNGWTSSTGSPPWICLLLVPIAQLLPVSTLYELASLRAGSRLVPFAASCARETHSAKTARQMIRARLSWRLFLHPL